MSEWTEHELQRLATPDELRISSRRDDGSYSKPVIIWMVAAGGDLIARSVHGENVPWYQAVKNRGVGRISVHGETREVKFEAPFDAGLDMIDAAYREKYAHYPTIVPTCLTEQARACTIRISPAE